MDSKQWYLSKTIWAGLVAALVGVLSIFKVGGNAAVEQESIVELIMQIVGVVAGAVAIYGRIKATTKIGG